MEKISKHSGTVNLKQSSANMTSMIPAATIGTFEWNNTDWLLIEKVSSSEPVVTHQQHKNSVKLSKLSGKLICLANTTDYTFLQVVLLFYKLRYRTCRSPRVCLCVAVLMQIGTRLFTWSKQFVITGIEHSETNSKRVVESWWDTAYSNESFVFKQVKYIRDVCSKEEKGPVFMY